MADRVTLNRTALERFVQIMEDTTSNVGGGRDSTSSRYARGDRVTPDSAFRGGVKVTVGSVDFAHPGRMAGEMMADRIAESMNFVVSLEEGTRALASIARQVLNAMSAQDDISAAELEEIRNSITDRPTSPYGMTISDIGHGI